MYKHCIMNEMEGKSILYTAQIQQASNNNTVERSKVINCLV